MARLTDMDEADVRHVMEKECRRFEPGAWTQPPPLSESCVALVTTAGLNVRGDRAFDIRTREYRVIPGEIKGADLLMSHVSVNFDRSGFQQDVNIVFPIDRLRELKQEGVIGSLARYHYSFMVAYLDSAELVPVARGVANILKADRVDIAFLVPV